MKIGIITDTHLSSNKYSKFDKNKGLNKFLIRQFESLEWVMNYFKENNINTILHAGDVFDSTRVSVYPVMKTKELFQGFDVHAIKGNHDDSNFLFDEKISALNLLDIDAISGPKSIQYGDVNIVFVPWRYEIDEDLVLDGYYNVLVAHGFPITYGSRDPKIIDSSNNKDGCLSNKTQLFDLVVTGHYHTFDEFKINHTKYLNPGSLSESGNSHGFGPSIFVFDTDTHEYERVKIPCAVKLIVAQPDNVESYVEDINDENIYRVVTKELPSKEIIMKAKKIALELQFKIIGDDVESHSSKKIDDFWKYVEDHKPNYKDDFKKQLLELDS